MLGLRFSSTSVHAVGVAGDMAQAYKRIRFVGALNSAPPTSFAVAFGTDTGSGNGASFSANAVSGYTPGQTCLWFGRYSTSIDGAPGATLPLHIPMAPTLGRLIVRDWILDTANDKCIEYLNGRRVCVRRGAAAKASWTSANAMSINRRPSDVAFQYGDLTVVEIQWSTSGVQASDALTDAMVASDPIGTAIGGATRWWDARDWTGGSSWTDRLGSKVLTITGTPTRQRLSSRRRSVGQLYFRGDSHGLRVFDGIREGDGYRRPTMLVLATGGTEHTSDGPTVAGAFTTLDYDTRHHCTPAQALGVANGATPSALSTLSTDLSTWISPDGTVFLLYLTNDAYVRCGVGGEGKTGAQGRDAYLTDVDSALALIGARLYAGGRIVLWCAPQVGNGAPGYQQAYLDMINLTNAELRGSWFATRQATYPGLRLADVDGRLTADHGSSYRNDTGVLVDAVHFADAVQSAVGATLAAAAL